MREIDLAEGDAYRYALEELKASEGWLCLADRLDRLRRETLESLIRHSQQKSDIDPVDIACIGERLSMIDKMLALPDELIGETPSMQPLPKQVNGHRSFATVRTRTNG